MPLDSARRRGLFLRATSAGDLSVRLFDDVFLGWTMCRERGAGGLGSCCRVARLLPDPQSAPPTLLADTSAAVTVLAFPNHALYTAPGACNQAGPGKAACCLRELNVSGACRPNCTVPFPFTRAELGGGLALGAPVIHGLKGLPAMLPAVAAQMRESGLHPPHSPTVTCGPMPARVRGGRTLLACGRQWRWCTLPWIKKPPPPPACKARLGGAVLRTHLAGGRQRSGESAIKPRSLL